MSRLGTAVTFAANLYRQRAQVAYAGYVRRQPFALLQLGPGRADPYAFYDQIRAKGPLTSVGGRDLASASHRVCAALLRDRRFGARPVRVAGAEEFDLSFLGMNPSDHTRLRRLAAPAFSPKAVASYTKRIEQTLDGLLDLASADGRFPEAYDQPGRFDLNRDGEVGNLAFSSGIHYCVGQPLARLEATIALRMLAERMPDLSRTGPIAQRHGVVIRGPLRLPVATGAVSPA